MISKLRHRDGAIPLPCRFHDKPFPASVDCSTQAFRYPHRLAHLRYLLAAYPSPSTEPLPSGI